MQRKEVEIGKSYRYSWADRLSVGEYIVTTVREDSYDAIWSNGVPITIRFGVPINTGSIEYDPSDLPALSFREILLPENPLPEDFFVEGILKKAISHDRDFFSMDDPEGNLLVVYIPTPFNGPHCRLLGKIRVRVSNKNGRCETHPGWITAAGV